MSSSIRIIYTDPNRHFINPVFVTCIFCKSLYLFYYQGRFGYIVSKNHLIRGFTSSIHPFVPEPIQLHAGGFFKSNQEIMRINILVSMFFEVMFDGFVIYFSAAYYIFEHIQNKSPFSIYSCTSAFTMGNTKFVF